jgi:hypothetical protein
MRLRVAAVLLAAFAVSACSGGGLFGKQYEYEEDLTIALDGSATLVVNASLPALAALRGLPVDPKASRIERADIRAIYESPVAEVTRVSRPWRRAGRRFVQVRLRIPDIRKLSSAKPFSWSQYQIVEENGQTVFRQKIGASALVPGTLTNVGWNGREIVAFRLHLPSRITYHNARDLETNETSDVARGNILSWEQQLADRLDGRPVEIEVRMESQSILYRTLWLFGGAFAAAMLVLASLIWWTVQKGRKSPGPAPL